MTWRVGRRVSRTIYLDDEPIAMLATETLAANIVGSLNERVELRAEVADLRILVAYLRDWRKARNEESGEATAAQALVQALDVYDAQRSTSGPTATDGKVER